MIPLSKIKLATIQFAVATIVLVLLAKGQAQNPPATSSAKPWRDSFKVDKANLVSQGNANPYFLLEPGRKASYAHGKATLIITVLKETKMVDGVETRIVEERETDDNEQLIEVSRNYFALDKHAGDVYYFGEDVDMYKSGKVVNHEGSWLSGVNGAKFGLMMPAHPKVGDCFYQELAPGVALDRSEIVSITEKIKTPAGTFDQSVKTDESSGIEAGGGNKWYAPQAGLVKDDEFDLVKIENP